MSMGEILVALFAGFPVSGEFLDPAWPEFLQRAGGLTLTLAVTIGAIAFGLPLGLVLALGRTGGGGGRRTVVRAVSIVLIEGIRGLPVLLLVLLTVYLPWPLFGWRVPGSILATVALSVYTAAYSAEIFRSGFLAVPAELLDAAKVLGLSRTAVLVRVRLPIAIRTMLPSFLSMAITVFKDTSVLVVVGVAELTWTARQVTVAHPDRYFVVLLLLLVFYGGAASIASNLVRRMEIERPLQ